jgi:predicted nucleic acid-binding Zn ribbon protein
MRECIICAATLKNNQTKLCGAEDCLSEYNKQRQRKYRQRKNRLLRNGIALQSNGDDVTVKNPPVRYKGGKWRLADWIIGYFPKHESYVEPFCGGASIFFQKTPSAIETLNDLNKNIVTFFDMLRAFPEELIRSIELTP